jgi:hypothetical protein
MCCGRPFQARLGTVTFATLVADKSVLKAFKGSAVKSWDATIFAFISHDDKLKRTVCELFSVGAKAKEICTAVNQGFELGAHIKKLRRTNPFAAFSSTREPIGGPLHVPDSSFRAGLFWQTLLRSGCGSL